jgi:hypothetical protein
MPEQVLSRIIVFPTEDIVRRKPEGESYYDEIEQDVRALIGMYDHTADNEWILKCPFEYPARFVGPLTDEEQRVYLQPYFQVDTGTLTENMWSVYGRYITQNKLFPNIQIKTLGRIFRSTTGMVINERLGILPKNIVFFRKKV